jgi:WD40 repeat protein
MPRILRIVFLLLAATLCAEDKWDLVLQNGESGRLTDIRFLPDGEHLITSFAAGTIVLWDITTGSKMREYPGFSSWPYSIAVTPDGGTVLAGGSGGIIAAWDTATGAQRWRLKSRQFLVQSLAVSSDGRTIAACMQSSGAAARQVLLETREIATGKLLASLSIPTREFSYGMRIAFAGDGRSVLLAFREGKPLAWNPGADAAALLQQLGELPVGNVQSSSRGDLSIDLPMNSSSLDVWRVANGVIRQNVSIDAGARVMRTSLSRDGKSVAIDAGNTVGVWDTGTGKRIKDFGGDRANSAALDISGDGTSLAMGSEDGRISIEDVRTGRHIAGLNDESSPIRDIAFSPAGDMLLFCSGYGPHSARVLNLAGHTITEIAPDERAVWSGSFSKDGKYAGLVAADNVVLWDLAARKRVWAVPQAGTVRFSPDGASVATSETEGDYSHQKYSVRLRSIRNSKIVWTYSANGPVEDLAFSPDGAFLIAVSNVAGKDKDGYDDEDLSSADVILLDAAKGEEIWKFTSPRLRARSIAISSDGDRMLLGVEMRENWAQGRLDRGGITYTTSLAKAEMWGLQGGVNLGTMATFDTAEGSAVFALSPDGSTVAGGNMNGVVSCWTSSDDWQSFTETARYPGHPGYTGAICFSPDGAILATGGPDSQIRIRNVQTGVSLRIYPIGSEWLMTADNGSFAWSQQGAGSLVAVRGMEVRAVTPAQVTPVDPALILQSVGIAAAGK